MLVEDNEGDARLTIEASKDGKINNELHHVKDGIEAIVLVKLSGHTFNSIFRTQWVINSHCSNVTFPNYNISYN